MLRLPRLTSLWEETDPPRVRVVDFDNVGAEFRQRPSQGGTSKNDAEVEHAHASECRPHGGLHGWRRRRRRACLQLGQDVGAMLIGLRRRPAHGAWSPRQAHVDTRLEHLAVLRIVDLEYHLRGTGMGMLEPLGARAADGALAAGFGDEVFPGLGWPRLEEFTCPLQMFLDTTADRA